MEHLENLKKDVVKAHDKEVEYAETLKSIKYGYMVEKSSETLALLLNSYQKQAAENDDLRLKLEVVENSKFELEQSNN